jgi:hypothetical protein
MTENMVERVAIALYGSFPTITTPGSAASGWAELPPNLKATWLASARAAITAMLAPTDAMEFAGEDEPYASPRNVWAAMIHEALK